MKPAPILLYVMSDIPDRLRSAFADRYPVERELGRGGMATVYLARDVKHDRPVALKILRQEYALDIGADRFLREIEIAAKLTHPNILPLYDSGEADGFLFYVMPYVAGESLRHRLDRENGLPVEDAVRIARQIADALGYAHRQGIIHRDIKPENILLEDGQAVVADFGIARAISAAGGEGLTASGLVVGTPQYMSPEQSSGEHEIDPRSDLYALGCVMHEMLTGEPPFMGRTVRSVIVKHMSETPPSVRAVRPDVPDWLEEVVHTALAKIPADRFSTAESFSQALATQTGPRPGLGGLLRRGRRRLITVGLAIAIAMAAGFFGARALDLRPGLDADAGMGAAALDPARLAVLYFEDLSEDQQLGPLCAAFTRKLIHELSGVAALDVVSYNGIKQYREADVTPDSLARALGVGTIVEASVAESGGQLRVLAQLIDAATARVIESREIERPRGETFALLDGVAQEVSEFLRGRLGVEIRLKERMAETESVEAWNLVQQAELLRDDFMPLVRAGDTASAALTLQRADNQLTGAAALDPDWTDPPVLRGWIAWQLAGLRSETPGRYNEDWLNRGLEHAERALEIEPGDPAALELRGTLRYGLWQTSESPQAALLDAAEEDLRATVEAAPSRAGAWNRLSTLLHLARGDFKEAKAAAERAYQADEFLEEAKDILFRLANLSLELSEYDDAIYWAEEGRRRFPDVVNFAAAELITLTMSPDGPEPDVEKAWELLDQIRSLSPPQLHAFHLPLATIQVAAVLARAGQSDSAVAVIERTRAAASDEVLAFIAYDEAHAWLLLGDRARALDALAFHLEHEPTDKEYIASDSWFAELRGDARFEALVGN